MARGAKPKFHVNHAGVQDFLMHDPGVITMMNELGHSTAAGAGGHTTSSGDALPIEVDSGVSTWAGHADRYVSRVTIAHPAGIPMEAKYGILQHAATAAGLEWGRKSHRITVKYKTKSGKIRRATVKQVAHWTRGSK